MGGGLGLGIGLLLTPFCFPLFMCCAVFSGVGIGGISAGFPKDIKVCLSVHLSSLHRFTCLSVCFCARTCVHRCHRRRAHASAAQLAYAATRAPLTSAHPPHTLPLSPPPLQTSGSRPDPFHDPWVDGLTPRSGRSRGSSAAAGVGLGGSGRGGGGTQFSYGTSVNSMQ